MPDELPDSKPPPKIFSEAEAQAALEQLKSIAAAQEAAAAAPPLAAPPEPVAMSAEELAANPEEARLRFAVAVGGLRETFAAWVAAKEGQFEQVLSLGWSGEHGDMAEFLKDLEQERKRLWRNADQTESDIDSTTEIMEFEESYERLEAMKSRWQKLRAEGVPKDQWPLDSGLTWAEQFQAQAEVDNPGAGT